MLRSGVGLRDAVLHQPRAGVTEPDRDEQHYDAMRELLEIYPSSVLRRTSASSCSRTDRSRNDDYNEAFPPSSLDAVRQALLGAGATLHVAQLDGCPPNGDGVPAGR